MSALQRFKDLPAGVKGGLAALAALDVGLRAYALADLAKRSPAEVNGSKVAWMVGLSAVNSVGLLPMLYFAKGRLPRVAPAATAVPPGAPSAPAAPVTKD